MAVGSGIKFSEGCPLRETRSLGGRSDPSPLVARFFPRQILEAPTVEVVVPRPFIKVLQSRRNLHVSVSVLRMMLECALKPVFPPPFFKEEIFEVRNSFLIRYPGQLNTPPPPPQHNLFNTSRSRNHTLHALTSSCMHRVLLASEPCSVKFLFLKRVLQRALGAFKRPNVFFPVED